MFQLEVVEGRQAGEKAAVRAGTFIIGKNPDADLRLADAGVWDDHLAVEWSPGGSPCARRLGEGLISINSQPLESAQLRNGDLIRVGAALLRFAASSVNQKSQAVTSALSWILLGMVLVSELALVLWLKSW